MICSSGCWPYTANRQRVRKNGAGCNGSSNYEHQRVSTILRNAHSKHQGQQTHPLQTNRAPRQRVHQPLVLIRHVPENHQTNQQPKQHVHTNHQQPTTQRNSPQRPERYSPQYSTIRQRRFNTPNYNSSQGTQHDTHAELQTKEPGHPERTTLNRNHELLPHHLLRTSRNNVNNQRQTQGHRRGHHRLPASQLTRLTRHQLQPNHQEQKHPS